MKLGLPSIITKTAEHVFTERMLPHMRAIYDERFMNFRGADWFFSKWEYFFKLAQFRFISDRIAVFDPQKTNISWIPINKEIEQAGEVALSEEILGRFIEKAKHRVILNFCGCRASMKCENYPIKVACLMLGEDALLIPEKSRREVGIEEAKAHVRKAIEAGLVPLTGKARIDNNIFMIPDRGKLLSICFCCECCCVSQYYRHVPHELYDQLQHPIEGLTIEVTEDCIGCGACEPHCYLNAIKVYGGRAVISDMCRVCGRCASNCPQKAIELKLANTNAVDDVVKRIEARIDY